MQDLLLDELAKAWLPSSIGSEQLLIHLCLEVVGANARQFAASWNLPGSGSLGSSQDEQASCTNVGEKISRKMRRVIMELKGVWGRAQPILFVLLIFNFSRHQLFT